MSEQNENFIRVANSIFGSGWGTQSKIAKALDVSQPTISNIFAGKIQPTEKLLRKLYELSESQSISNEVQGLNSISDKIKEQVYKENSFEDIKKRFSIMKQLVYGVAKKEIPALIISGSAGVGKSWMVNSVLQKAQAEFESLKGTAGGVGLYKLLWETKDSSILVIDDCDGIFSNEDALNILKSALDSTATRTISWKKLSSYLENADIPDKFEYNGSVIFLTNLDFNAMANSSSKLSPHFAALLSRCLYLDLTMRTNRDKLFRIKDVIFNEGMLKSYDLSSDDEKTIVDFLELKIDKWREVSLRLIHHIARIYKTSNSNWKEICEISLMKNL